MSAAEINAVQTAYREAVKAEKAAAAAQVTALIELARLRESSGIAVPSVDETLAAMQAAGIFYAWRRPGWRDPRLVRKTEKGLAPVVETWLRPWLTEHVAVDMTQAQVVKVLRADPVKHFPVVDGVPS